MNESQLAFAVVLFAIVLTVVAVAIGGLQLVGGLHLPTLEVLR